MFSVSALRRFALPVVVIALMVIVTSAVPAKASQVTSARGDPYVPEGKIQDGVLEVGVEWVNNYHGWDGCGNLANTGNDANGLVYQLSTLGGAITRFNWGNDNAWENDWHGNPAYIDEVDLAYFSGHGSSGGIYFGSSMSDHTLSIPTDCQSTWGKKDLDWLALSACQTMTNHNAIANCMNGSRLTLGFVTTMTDSANFGSWFGWYLRNGYTFYNAFFNSVWQDQPSGSIARIVAEDSQYFNDRLYNHASPTTVDNYYSYTTYTKGLVAANKPEAAPMSAAEAYEILDGSMPVYTIGAINPNAQWAELLNAFGLTAQANAPVQTEQFLDNTIRTSTDFSLLMDETTGLYGYTPNPAVSAASKPGIPMSQARAASADPTICPIVNAFLSTSSLLPAQGATCDSVAILGVAQGAQGLDAPVSEMATSYEVTFTSNLSYTPVANGPTVTFDLVGPGGKIVLDFSYGTNFNAASPDAALLAGLEGIMGGFHVLNPVAANQPMVTTPIITDAQVQAIFNQLEKQLALGYTPLSYLTRTVGTKTLGYYEKSLGQSQTEEIPVYILPVTYNQAGSTSITSDVYIPSSVEYMAPLAIINYSQVPSTISVGQHVALSALDASQTLAQNGFDPLLNFAPGVGPYTYSWYLGSESGTLLGSGRTLDFVVPSLTPGDHAMNTYTIVLKVTDTGSTHSNIVATASYMINVGSIINLPMVNR